MDTPISLTWSAASERLVAKELVVEGGNIRKREAIRRASGGHKWLQDNLGKSVGCMAVYGNLFKTAGA